MKKIIITDKAPGAIGPYSQAVEKNRTLYISGQIPMNPETGKIVEGGVKEQTEQVMKNITAILEESGYMLKDVVKSTVFLTDMNNFQNMNEVYGRYYDVEPPARSAYQVGKLPLDVMVEIETIAMK